MPSKYSRWMEARRWPTSRAWTAASWPAGSRCTCTLAKYANAIVPRSATAAACSSGSFPLRCRHRRECDGKHPSNRLEAGPSFQRPQCHRCFLAEGACRCLAGRPSHATSRPPHASTRADARLASPASRRCPATGLRLAEPTRARRSTRACSIRHSRLVSTSH